PGGAGGGIGRRVHPQRRPRPQRRDGRGQGGADDADHPAAAGGVGAPAGAGATQVAVEVGGGPTEMAVEPGREVVAEQGVDLRVVAAVRAWDTFLRHSAPGIATTHSLRLLVYSSRREGEAAARSPLGIVRPSL